MAKRLIYLTHWRIPSEKTLTPHTLKTCAYFMRLGWEVELWGPRRHTMYRPSEDAFALHHISPRFPVRKLWCIDVMRFLGTFGFVLMVATFNVSAYIHLRRLSRRTKKGDIVVYAPDIRDVLLPSRAGLPAFVEIHDFYISSLDVINRMAFSHITGLIVTNRLKLEHIARRYGVPKDRMIHQPNAVEAKDFDIDISQADARAELGLPQEGHLALYTGHLFGWKGVYTLADAAAFLPADISVLFVGGTEEDRAALAAYVNDNHLPRISFVPHQTPDKIPLYQKAADVLVLPNTAKEEASRVETSPVKLFEYLASGKPIVASDIPSIRDVVSEKEVFFARADDGESFARTIVEALGKSEEKRQPALTLARMHSWESRAEHIDAFMNAQFNHHA